MNTLTKFKDTTKLTIGVLAREAGVGVETIRFYERKGLLKKPEKKPGRYRQYQPEDSKRVHFIRRAQDLGFTLREVKDILDMDARSVISCRDMKPRAQAKLQEIEGKIEDLVRMKKALIRLRNCCGRSDAKKSGVHCRVLDCFESGCRCCEE